MLLLCFYQCLQADWGRHCPVQRQAKSKTQADDFIVRAFRIIIQYVNVHIQGASLASFAASSVSTCDVYLKFAPNLHKGSSLHVVISIKFYKWRRSGHVMLKMLILRCDLHGIGMLRKDLTSTSIQSKFCSSFGDRACLLFRTALERVL